MKFLASVGVWLALVQVTLACPMCANGDPADFFRGEQELEQVQIERKVQRWSVAFDARTFSSSEGLGGEESHRQTQFGISAAFRPTSRWFLFARVPYSSTTMTETDGHDVVNGGIGDAEVLGSYEFNANVLGWHPAASIGFKAPTGDNECPAESESVFAHSHSLDHGSGVDGRLDEHGQIGTGGWDAMFMGHLRRSGTYHVSTTFGYRTNGTNDFGYRYGGVSWFDAVVGRSLNEKFSAGLGARLRYSERNNDRGVDQLNSGGTIVYVIPEAGFSINESLRLTGQCAIPVVNDLNGTQTERLGLFVALTQSF